MDSTVKRGKRVTTTHGEINLFSIGVAALGIGATMWVLGLGLVPKDVTKTIPGTYHPGHWETFLGAHGDQTRWVSGYSDPPTDVTVTTVTLAERPRMVLPFVGGTGSNGTAGATGIGGGPWSFWSGFLGPLIGLP